MISDPASAETQSWYRSVVKRINEMGHGDTGRDVSSRCLARLCIAKGIFTEEELLSSTAKDLEEFLSGIEKPQPATARSSRWRLKGRKA